MKQNKIWPILRDVIIVTVLTCLGGFIVGFASTDHSSKFYFYGLALSNSLFCIIGFAIGGCLAVGNRWRHLAFVAAIVWAVSIFNVMFFGFPIVMWMASVVAVAIFALTGGGISLLFDRKNLVEISSDVGDEKYYEEVARELQEKSMVAGLWTKAYSEMGGDDLKTRALYIKYRVAQLAEAGRQKLEETLQAAKRKNEIDKKGQFRDLCGKCQFFEKTGIVDYYKGHCSLHARETFSNYGCEQYKAAYMQFNKP